MSMNMPGKNATYTSDHLVIGAGIAGLTLALRLADHGRVVLLAKGPLNESATNYAQGGIASVLREDDSFSSHVEDTLDAGAGLCHVEVVKKVVESGPQAIRELLEFGVRFTRDEKDGATFHLNKEGGHSARRIYHADDATGKEIVKVLIEQCSRHPNIEVLMNYVAVDLLTTDKYAPDFSRNACLGAYVLDRSTLEVFQIRSSRTYLCTGGHGRAYLYTSNPDSATGDGLAMGYRAGCKVANLEFMQFHPTCLYDSESKNFLISEAVRGEGAVIRNRCGEEFVKAYDRRGSLAPRDIVARAIDFELKKSGEQHAFLDMTSLGEKLIAERFPNILKKCLGLGIDPARQWVPVVPAAHYSCGGLVVNENGQTCVQGLYALGEVACTGLHGANRLASNSLLEAVVYSKVVSEHVLGSEVSSHSKKVLIPDWHFGEAVPPDELVVLNHAWDEIRRTMWNYVGIVRSEKRLQRALDRISALKDELDSYYWEYRLTEELVEVRNLVQVAWLIIKCARSRKESRGIHYNLDFPDRNDLFYQKDIIL